LIVVDNAPALVFSFGGSQIHGCFHQKNLLLAMFIKKLNNGCLLIILEISKTVKTANSLKL
jgi:hypothetical protein